MDLSGPCNWPAMGCPSCDGVDCVSSAVRAELEAMAQFQLWAATGRVYGTCEVSVYPCNDYSTLCSCGNAFRDCGCVSVSEIQLPGPVASVTSVVIDGVELDDSAYRIDDWQWLVRLDGGTWPANVDPTDADGFVVTYELGETPPAGAGINVGRLVCSWSPCANSGCRLPKNAQQISRQGVTMVNNLEGFGILEVDQWVASVNAPLRAGAVHSPDLPHVRQTTWEATSP